jgi:catechol 2,3-dioxygenase-like lactoylglutathione lyase family enzyme
MQGLIRVLRTHSKHAAILLAAGLAFQLAPLHSGAQNKPKRPRITGIDHVRLYVTDMDGSQAFYRNYVGLGTTAAGACRTNAYPCLPVNRQQQIELQVASSLGPKNWVAEIGYATDDIEQMRRYLLAHGVEATPVTNEPNGARHFELLDPEGNPLAFVQRTIGFAEWLTFLNQVSTRLLHAGFVVKDAAAENRFYVDLLGFRLYWYGGMKDDGVDWYELQVPDGDNWIEYMLNVPATADHKQLGAQNHFSFGVNEIQAAADQLRKNGVEKIAGPGIGRDGKRGLNVYDPDGTRVEVTEFTPAQKPCCHPYTAPHPTP